MGGLTPPYEGTPMNLTDFNRAAQQQLDSERKRLQILVGTDQISPDEARKRLAELKDNIERKASNLQYLKDLT